MFKFTVRSFGAFSIFDNLVSGKHMAGRTAKRMKTWASGLSIQYIQATFDSLSA